MDMIPTVDASAVVSADVAPARSPCCQGHADCGVETACRPYPDRLPWLWKCDICGIQFSHPQPSEAELCMCYGPDYFQGFGAGKGAQETAYSAMKRHTFQRLFHLVHRFAAPGRLLDVGCGLGEALAVAESLGWKVRGIERIASAAERACSGIDGIVSITRFEDWGGSESRFDQVLLADVLEHLRDPFSALARTRELLVSGGIVVITTPNSESLLAQIMRDRWFHYHRDHLWYFSKRALRQALISAGFSVLYSGHAFKTYTPRYIMNCLGMAAVPSILASARQIEMVTPTAVLDYALPPLPDGMLFIAKCIT